MARYIDADLLKQAIFAKWYTCEEIDETIDQQPTADVVEVVHGEWVDTGSGQECSICKEIQYGYDSARNYCANCGARMDERRKNERKRCGAGHTADESDPEKSEVLYHKA